MLLMSGKALEADSYWAEFQMLQEPREGWRDHGGTIAIDPAGYAHFVWPHESSSDRNTYFYSRSEDGQTWTQPLDIFVATTKFGLGWPVLLADDHGWLHMFWIANSYILYSRAWALDADSAKSWSYPAVIVTCSESCSVPLDVTLGEDGNFHIVFTLRTGNVQYIRSQNGEIDNWTSPVEASTVLPNQTTFLPKISISEEGRVHVVWTEMQLPDGPSLGVYYAYSDDGLQWSTPLQLGERYHSDSNVLAIGEQLVYIAWNGGVGAGGRYFQHSRDGGKTWSEAIRFSAKSGQTGYPGIVMDNQGVVHIVTGDGEYVTWDGAYLSQILFQLSDYIYIERLRLGIVRGNHLIALWPSNFEGMYASYLSLNVPPSYATVLATPTVMVISQTTSTPATASIQPAAANTSVIETDQSDNRPNSSGASLLLSLIVSASFILLVVWRQFTKHRGRIN